VIGCGFLLRRILSRRLSLATALAISCAAIVTVSTALYPTPIFWANAHGFDDVYWIFILVPGVHIYQLGRLIGFAVAPSLEPVTSFHTASIFALVIIPGVIGVLLGSLQWYLIGRLWQKLWPNHSPEPMPIGAVHATSRQRLTFLRVFRVFRG